MAQSIPTSDINNPQSKVSAHQNQTTASSSSPGSDAGINREDSVLLAVSSQEYQFQPEGGSNNSATTTTAPWPTSSTTDALKKQFHREWINPDPAAAATSDATHKKQSYEYNP